MTATLNDLTSDSLHGLPSPISCPAEDAVAPVLTITVNDRTVLTIARRMHDGSCIDGPECDLRDYHALDAYETDVRSMLASLVHASMDGDSTDLSICRSTMDRRWFQGKWWCQKCNTAVRFCGGVGWVHGKHGITS